VFYIYRLANYHSLGYFISSRRIVAKGGIHQLLQILIISYSHSVLSPQNYDVGTAMLSCRAEGLAEPSPTCHKEQGSQCFSTIIWSCPFRFLQISCHPVLKKLSMRSKYMGPWNESINKENAILISGNRQKPPPPPPTCREGPNHRDKAYNWAPMSQDHSFLSAAATHITSIYRSAKSKPMSSRSIPFRQ
jgi:hypothetical protein